MHLFKAVKNANFISDYKLLIQFEDKSVRMVDLEKHLKGEIYEPLKLPDYFQQFHVNKDTETIEWPNEADFSPDFLFTIGTEID